MLWTHIIVSDPESGARAIACCTALFSVESQSVCLRADPPKTAMALFPQSFEFPILSHTKLDGYKSRRSHEKRDAECQKFKERLATQESSRSI